MAADLDMDMPILHKEKRQKMILSNTDGSGDEFDDLSSNTSTTQEDLSIRSDTPPVQNRKGNKGKLNRPKRCKVQFRCTNYLKEDHGQPIFGLHINQYTKDGDPVIFATVGHNRVTIYECVDNGKINLLQAFVDSSEYEENFYCCVWTINVATGQPLLIAAGLRGVIRVFCPVLMQNIKCYKGHGNAINELKIHPRDANLLMSVSKDHTLRIWNIKTDVCVLIFGGVDGHRDEVLSADFDMTGDLIVSCGMDHSLKIWKTNTEEIQQAIEASYNFNKAKADKKFPTLCHHFPDFSTRDVHRNYVDCVRWFGKFVFSKSCENCIVCWKPGSLSEMNVNLKPNDSKVTILHRFEYKDCDIWYMRFALDFSQKMIALGNQVGKIYIWDLEAEDPTQTKPTVLMYPKCYTAIRQTAFSRDSNILLAVGDDATVWRWDRVK